MFPGRPRAVFFSTTVFLGGMFLVFLGARAGRVVVKALTERALSKEDEGTSDCMH